MGIGPSLKPVLSRSDQETGVMNKEAIDWSKYWGQASALGIGGATVPASFYTSQEQFDAERMLSSGS